MKRTWRRNGRTILITKGSFKIREILQTKCIPLSNQEIALSRNLESNCFEVFLLKFYLCSHARLGNKAVWLMFHFRWNASIFCAGTHLWDSLECSWRTHLEMTVSNLWRLMFPLCPWYDQTTSPPPKKVLWVLFQKASSDIAWWTSVAVNEKYWSIWSFPC